MKFLHVGMPIVLLKIMMWYRSVVSTDHWFDVDPEYRQLADNVLNTFRNMYDAGCNVVMAATTGVYTTPRRLCTIFRIESQWELRSYTKKSTCTTQVGKRILGGAFPFQEKYIKAHFISAPLNECLFVEYINSSRLRKLRLRQLRF
mmetsp:Transcript_20858/g.31676  ORF Transcript_20858/g.31676 Transcript_20858/m.31676 type:complete len:146 (-) Transcript_20858:670-1107(-)